MSAVLKRLPLDPQLAFEFLGVFARCEFALKYNGYAHGGVNGVEPRWEDFGREIDEAFCQIKHDGLRAAVSFLLSKPPRKQVLVDGHLHWKDSPPNVRLPQTVQVLLMVRRVRNNLFHGAKVWSPEQEYGSRERDERLIRASMLVLQHAITVKPKIRFSFGQGVF